MTDGGLYCLVVALDRRVTAGVGALGTVEFDEGAYVYVGSAHGPGGFARVDRHRELAAGNRSGRHWHIDHLLTQPGASVVQVVTTAGADAECALAQSLSGERIHKFGCTDCDCPSHLARYPDRRPAIADAVGAPRALPQSSTNR